MAKKSKRATKSRASAPVSDLLRLPPGPVDLASIDANGHPGFDGDKAAGKAALPLLAPEMAELQERLYANGRRGGRASILLVLQGMDTSGKGGTVRHSVGLLDPQGVDLTSFKAPTPEEKRRGFLWRIKQRVPGPGMVGIFDRSHYEDVLIGRVRQLATPSTIEKRYGSI
ncbi:MAG: polyphosphate kinase 2 family protein, partial [Propionibacteriales bacterium]|nr:polyphosphate kinase 2 family protein [Propionibacteriales bacterium]